MMTMMKTAVKEMSFVMFSWLVLSSRRLRLSRMPRWKIIPKRRRVRIFGINALFLF